MNTIAKIATMLFMQAFNRSPAGGRIMTGVNSAKTAQKLWEKFPAITNGE